MYAFKYWYISFQIKNCFCKQSFRFLVNTTQLFICRLWKCILILNNKTLGIILIKVFLLYSGNHVSLLIVQSSLCQFNLLFTQGCPERVKFLMPAMRQFPVHIRENFFGLYFLYFSPCCSIYLFGAHIGPIKHLKTFGN